jgi:cytoskeletal protein RodZ
MTNLGQELRREREQRTVSIKDFSNRTKISLRVLEALEKGDAQFLPEPFFIKSILRAYAKEFGLPEDHFYASYLKDTSPETGPEKASERTAPEPPAPTPSAGKRRAKPSRRRVAPALGLAGLILVVAAAAAYIFFLKGQRSPAPVIPIPKPETPSLPAVSASELPPVVEAGSIPDGADLKLELRFSADTWIQVAADGIIQLDGIRKAGERSTCTAKKEFILQTGNAGGFALSLNGLALNPLGAKGAVLTDVRIGRDTFRSLMTPPDKAPAKKAGR